MSQIRWTPSIGDPTFLGWFTVFAYFFCAWLCFLAFMAEKPGPSRPYWSAIRSLFRVFWKRWPTVPIPARRSALWLTYGVLLLLLGINKQLDLQSLLTELARAMAKQQGWYERRRAVQVAFLFGLTFAGGAGLVLLLYLMKGGVKDFFPCLLGATVIVGFVILRAATFNKMTPSLVEASFDTHVTALLELSGIGLIALGAHLRIRRDSRRPPRARDD
jgi:hypothetical protein